MKNLLLIFLLFYTLTSANDKPIPIYIVKKEPVPRQDKMFIIEPDKNNEFSKEISEQLKYYNLINKELDSLPQWIKYQ